MLGPTLWRLLAAIGLAYLPWLWINSEEAWLWWAALAAPVAGALGWRAGKQPAGQGSWLRLWPGALVVAAWGEAWLWVTWWYPVEFSREAWWGGLGAVLGLAAMGWGMALFLGRGAGWSCGRATLWVAAATSVFYAWPIGFGLSGSPHWSPTITALALSCSPAGLALECAGWDWMRMPAIYEAAGADRIGPDLRIGWGSLAGWGALVVGCLLAAGGQIRLRRRTPPS